MKDFHLCPVRDSFEFIVLPVTYSVVFLMGLTLNVALLWSVHCGAHKQRVSWSGTVIYVTNLSVADLLYVLSLPTLIISYSMGGSWPFGDFTCKTVRFFFLVNLHCSMMFLTCVSVYRFLMVCFPIAALRLRKRKLAVLVSSSIWVMVTLEVSPTLAFAHTGFINNMTVCFKMTDPEHFNRYFPYGMFLTIAGFLIPFLVTITCSCSTIKVLCVSGTYVRTGRVRNKSLCNLLVVFVIFVVCFLPYHVNRTVYLFVRVYLVRNCNSLDVTLISLKAWEPLVSLNCCANPLIYFLGSGRYRRELRAWLSKRRRSVHPTVRLVEAHNTHLPGPCKGMENTGFVHKT